MRCDPVKKLVPLYVEGDLSGRRAARVRGHLQDCLSCRSLLEGYRASQRALRASAAPEITGAALEQLRRAVWSRITRVPPRSALGRQLDRGWAALRQWTSQPAMAALVVFAVVGGSFALSRATGPGATAERRAPAAGRQGWPSWNDELALREDGNGDERAAAENGDDPGEPMLAQASFDEGADAEPAPEPTGDEAAPAGDDSVRIEIQTRDPNVRIIWFSPTEDHAPGVED
jgi:hypothetical protein